MAGIKVISETAISTSQMKQALEIIKERDKELNFRAQRTEEYLQHIKTVKDPEALIKKLEKLDIPRLKDTYLKKIVDLLPTTSAELKIILQGYALTVTKDNLKKIVDVVDEFVKKEE